MSTQIQLALDVATTAIAVETASAAVSSVNILEAGTVLVLNDGLGAVRELRERFPNHPLVADIRIGRAGAKFAAMAFDSGADRVTVLGESPEEVVEGALKAARSAAGQVEVELPPVWDVDDIRRWADLGVARVIAHRTGQRSAADDEDIRQVLDRLAACDLGRLEVTLAGGFGIGDAKYFAKQRFDVVAIGSAITKASDPGAAASQLRTELDSREEALTDADL